MTFLAKTISLIVTVGQRLACLLGFGLTYYRWSIRFWRSASRQRWVQRLLLGSDDRIVERFVNAICPSASVTAGALEEAAMSSICRRPLLSLLRRATATEWTQLVEVVDRAILDAALAEGRGVILLHYHSAYMAVYNRWLPRQELPSAMTLWTWSWSRSKEDVANPDIRATGGAAELLAALENLDNGGIVQVLADGRKGSHGQQIPVAGRLLTIQPTFAELSLLSGAPILPVAAAMEKNGTITIRFFPSLDRSNENADERELVTNLQVQYVDFLLGQWRAWPGQYKTHRMQRYLDLPHA